MSSPWFNSPTHLAKSGVWLTAPNHSGVPDVVFVMESLFGSVEISVLMEWRQEWGGSNSKEIKFTTWSATLQERLTFGTGDRETGHQKCKEDRRHDKLEGHSEVADPLLHLQRCDKKHYSVIPRFTCHDFVWAGLRVSNSQCKAQSSWCTWPEPSC